MKKEWFILINGRKEGPYTLLALKADPRLTPDTLVWKKGFKEWIAMRHVPELQELFKDKPESKPLHGEEAEPLATGNLIADQQTLTMQMDPSQFFLWLLVLLLILLYIFYQFNNLL